MILKTLSVSEVNKYIKKTIDIDCILNNISVKGEISNLKIHTSGHVYFTLKDTLTKISCVMFSDVAYDIDFEDFKEGTEVIVYGRVSVYEREGRYQLYCSDMELAGVGKMHLEFEKLKAKLKEEGLFDTKYKKKLPSMPKKIGVVTSPTGAVIRDIINVSKRRNQGIDITLAPCRVQGEGAEKTIIDGINQLNEKSNIDVIIVARGGGSEEELWAYNSEELARVIFNSEKPIISAIGHETDFTIADFVSDLRAPTPSAAAELAVPDTSSIRREVQQKRMRLDSIVDMKVRTELSKLKSMKRLISLLDPYNHIKMQEKSILQNKIAIEDRMISTLKKEFTKIENLRDIIEVNNPYQVIKKGYSIVEDMNGKIITTPSELNKEVKITMKGGAVKARLEVLEVLDE